MDLSYGADYESFRTEVRSFIATHRDKQPKASDGIGARQCEIGKNC